MKTFKLLVCLTLMMVSTFFMHAQTEKGKMMLNGSSTLGNNYFGAGLSTAGFSSIKSKDSNGNINESETIKSSNIGLSPKVGYFLVDNLAIGVSGIFSFSSTTQSFLNIDLKINSTVITAGPFVKYYFPLQKLLPFVEAGVGLGSISTSGILEESSKSSLFTYAAGVGAAFPIGKKITFDSSINYNFLQINDEDPTFDNIAVITNFSVNLGFTVYLGGGKSSKEE